MTDLDLSAIIQGSIPLGAWVALTMGTLLLFLSGYMSSSEVSFFSLRPADLDAIRAGEHSADERLYKLLSEPERLLATILIGNNIVNIAIVILFGYAFGLIFDFSAFPITGFVLQTVVLTLLLLFFGEIVPKVYAQRRPLAFSRASAPYMLLIERAVYPLATVLMSSTKLISGVMERKRYDLSMADLSQAVDLLGGQEDEDKAMFEEIINFHNKTASEIMVPRIDMVDIDLAWPYDRMLAYVLESGYSRIPVYEGSKDNIRGIMYLKDLIPHRGESADFAWDSLIRKAYFVPENKPLDDLLEEFRTNKIHMAIVVDEYGGTSGLVTMEDLLEEIVGDISDEYDEETLPYKRMPDGTYLFEAKTPIGDALRYLDLEPGAFGKAEEEVDTLGGLYLELKQDLPKVGDSVQAGAWRMKVIELERFRIISILLTPP